MYESSPRMFIRTHVPALSLPLPTVDFLRHIPCYGHSHSFGCKSSRLLHVEWLPIRPLIRLPFSLLDDGMNERMHLYMIACVGVKWWTILSNSIGEINEESSFIMLSAKSFNWITRLSKQPREISLKLFNLTHIRRHCLVGIYELSRFIITPMVEGGLFLSHQQIHY